MVRVVLKEVTPMDSKDEIAPTEEEEEEVRDGGFFGLSVFETRVVLVALPLLLILLVLQTIRGGSGGLLSSSSKIQLSEGVRLEKLVDKIEVFSALLNTKMGSQQKCADALSAGHDAMLSTLTDVRTKHARIAERIAILNKLATQTIVNSNYADVLQPIIYKVKEANEHSDTLKASSSKLLKSLHSAEGNLNLTTVGVQTVIECPAASGGASSASSCPVIEPCGPRIDDCECAAPTPTNSQWGGGDRSIYILLGVVIFVYNVCFLYLYINRLRSTPS